MAATGMKKFLALALKVIGAAVAAVVLLLAAFGLVMFIVVNFWVAYR